MPDRCKPGQWVEVERVLLEPHERSSDLPPDTAAMPLRVWVRGLAQAEAALGDSLTVETMTGRLATGRLSAIEPGYTHTFGSPPPEIVAIGRDLRARLAAWRDRHDVARQEADSSGSDTGERR